MIQPPFKLKGIYARKMDSEKELDYKQTKKGNIWKAVVGERDEAFYEVLWFYEEWEFKTPEAKTYFGNYSNMSGEIFDLADWHKGKLRSSEYCAVKFQGNTFEFGNEVALLSGILNEDILHFNILNRKDGSSYSQRLRYVPWL